ncbi:MAG TPA: MFS transporter [Verrucomicrobiae bacterium]|jgi:SHS family lactate transporter-like MFS transporter|nr:MFS transporter [Verrucomicrobiae bacterium]
MHPPSNSDTRNAVLAGYLGWALDAFDFFVLVFVLSKAAADFQVSMTTITLAITVTLAFRPVGALLFGLLADRYGRRRPMMWNLVFFSVMEVLSGLAPNFTVFMICRALFGIGMGGEWGVGAALAMEKAPLRWRGVFSGLLQQGYPTGYLLAACCFRFLPADWSWRSLFIIGGLPALLAVFVRYKVKESAAWEARAHKEWGHLWQAIRGNWKLFLYLTILMTAMNFASHGTQDLYPSFLEQERHLTKIQVGNMAILYNIGAILGGITFGFLSDRWGRRRSMTLAFVLGALMIPLWSAGSTTALLALGAFLMQFMVQGAWGIIPAHLTELAPEAVRGFLPGFAYQCGVLLAGNAAHLQMQWARHGTFSGTMAMMALLVFAIGSAVIMGGPEKRGKIFGP